MNVIILDGRYITLVRLRFEITDDARLIVSVSAEDFLINLSFELFRVTSVLRDIDFFFFCARKTKNRTIPSIIPFLFLSLALCRFPISMSSLVQQKFLSLLPSQPFSSNERGEKRMIINREINLKKRRRRRKRKKKRKREKNRSLKQHVAISLCNRITQGELIYSLATCN